MAQQQDITQQFIRPGILQSRIRDRERQAALGRGLGALLENRPGQADGQSIPPAPLPTLTLDDSAPPAYQPHQSRALLERIQGTYRNEAGAALADAVHTVSRPGQRAGDPEGARFMRSTDPVRAPARSTDADPVVYVRGRAFPMARDSMVILMDLDMILPNPFVPLSHVDKVGLDRLIESIKAHGFLRPLVVMPSTLGNVMGDQAYWIISGERSWQAARLMGINQVPVHIHEVSPREAIQMVLADDLHSKRLPTMDRARLCGVLNEQMAMDRDEIAERLAIPREWVDTTLTYLELEPEIQDTLNTGQLSEAAGQALAAIESRALRMEIWRYAARHQWSAERIGRAVRDRIEPKQRGKKQAA